MLGVPLPQTYSAPPLPAWLEEIRPDQWQAVQEILAAYDSGAEVVWLSAPTGAGKSLIAELVRRELQTRALYLCTTTQLQDQILGAFPYAKLLKGRKHYRTLTKPFPLYTAEDCDKEKEVVGWRADRNGQQKPIHKWFCSWCPEVDNCPYEVAKNTALNADLCVTNTAYFLPEANYVGRLSKQEFIVMDEGDMVEDQLMHFADFTVSARNAKDLGISLPVKGAHKSTIREFLYAALTAAKQRERSLSDRKKKTQIQRFIQSVESMTKTVLDETWIRDYRSSSLSLKPVLVDKTGGSVLWEHGKKWLVMSATLISPQVLAESTGLDRKWSVVNVSSTFPIESRRIKVAPVATVISKAKETEWPKLIPAIVNILAKHPNDRVLIHTVSYELAKFVTEGLSQHNGHRAVITYTNAKDKDRAVARFRDLRAAVLVASSLGRGLDLPDDDARVVIVCKVPFPYLGDKQVSARMRMPGGQTWFDTQTIRSLVQMTGRATRHKDDWSVSYLLDRKFLDVYKKRKHFFPAWWLEALDFNVNVNELLTTNN